MELRKTKGDFIMGKSFFALDNYVTVTQNNSNIYAPSDIVNICKRKKYSTGDLNGKNR